MAETALGVDIKWFLIVADKMISFPHATQSAFSSYSDVIAVDP
jgi:hypothetical protein